MDNICNRAHLRGVLSSPPRFSHFGRDGAYYVFTLSSERLSGTCDDINVIARSRLLENLEISASEKIDVLGEIRSFNNKSGVGPRLVITVFARALWFDDGEDENIIELSGVLCKPPNLRVTPMGREICDLMLAVRRRYGRSDYLPCIAWGSSARAAACWDVGSAVRLTGRIQSRAYLKVENGETVEKTAYEVSVIHIEPED